MIEKKYGRIINIYSQLDIKDGVELVHYLAAKAAVIGFTKSLVQEVAIESVLVNAIASGSILTSIIDDISEGWKIEKIQGTSFRAFWNTGRNCTNSNLSCL